jgi:LacI family transcriptional regulator, repressor for deo operon, udp, cdd, tsx, nupC, and nupG
MAEPSNPHILEVPKRAGVSTATVSRVLSRPNMVSAKTRRRVIKAFELLGYVPNATAKNQGRSDPASFW